MRPLLPSTTALRVFEAAARHLTCTGAADELCLTQSAVSKQIRALEDSLGVSLFVRVNRGLVLTELGRSYLDEIKPLLHQLAMASERLATRRTSPSTLTLRILAIVGDRWLLPRFSSFAKAHPGIEVQFTSLLSKDGTEQSEPDGEFRFGEGSWPGMLADYLFGCEMLLLAAPALLEQASGLNRHGDVVSCTLLQHFQIPQAWQEFFQAFGVEPRQPPKVLRYEFMSTLIHSAVAGMGLALVPRVFVQNELARGQLVNLFAATVVGRCGYYFAFPERKRNDPALAMMRAWLLAQAQVTEGAAVASEDRALDSE